MSNKLSAVDDIVSTLDNMVSNGVGHMNVSVDTQGTGELSKQSTETMGCIDCAKGNLACSVPTLHEGIDEGLQD